MDSLPCSSSSSGIISFDSGHSELIHDAQLDYYGRRLATASSDKTIKIFDIQGDKQVLISTIRGHDGPVWSLSWAHPRYGCVLASCSYDGRIIIWKDSGSNNFIKIFEYYRIDTSINTIAFAPDTFGLILAAGLSDGNIAIFTKKDNNINNNPSLNNNNTTNSGWNELIFFGHKGGVNSISWGPDIKSGALLSNAASNPNNQSQSTAAVASQTNPIKFDRSFVSGGCDGRIRIWKYDESNNVFNELSGNYWNLGGANNHHNDWIRDVSWCPCIGLPNNIIASCSDDKTVIIWNQDINTGIWSRSKVLNFNCKIWRLSWSIIGNILAVSQGDNQISLWKQSINGDWISLSNVQQDTNNNANIINNTTFNDAKLDF